MPIPLEDVTSRTDFLRLGTPFDYKTNCLIGIPTDTPPPTSDTFEAAIEQAVLQTIVITQGRALVLFTSYGSLERLHNRLQGHLADHGITSMKQGEMPRHQLLDVFRGAGRAALFATSSFWEGIDVQGSALECLILVRLPFRVPTTPILEARTERIDKGGGNSFRDLTIPLAVIRFKQGFGRLIRSKTDRGIVLILDNRVVTKYYGRIFMRSLPDARIVKGATKSVIGAFRSFYSAAPTEAD